MTVTPGGGLDDDKEAAGAAEDEEDTGVGYDVDDADAGEEGGYCGCC